MSEPENHTLALLREMRAEFRADQKALREEVSARFDRLERRIDAMHANGLKALQMFIGHRSMAERTMASFEMDVTELKRRVSELEARVAG